MHNKTLLIKQYGTRVLLRIYNNHAICNHGDVQLHNCEYDIAFVQQFNQQEIEKVTIQT